MGVRPGRGVHQGRASIHVSEIRVCVVLAEQTHGSRMAFERRQHEHRASGFVPRIDIHTWQHGLHCRAVPLESSGGEALCQNRAGSSPADISGMIGPCVASDSSQRGRDAQKALERASHRPWSLANALARSAESRLLEQV